MFHEIIGFDLLGKNEFHEIVTDGPTGGRRSLRDLRKPLRIFYRLYMSFPGFTDGPIDEPMDEPMEGRTDGQTDPLIETHWCI